MNVIQQKIFSLLKIAICPVCSKATLLKRQGKNFLSVAHIVPWFLTDEQLLQAVIKGTFQDSHSERDKIHWACDKCLESGKAILANPMTQTYNDCAPYYAYFDLHMSCRTCSKKYVFTSAEQKFWYEVLKFWVQSQPKDCVDCRQEKRKKQRDIQQENDGKGKSKSNFESVLSL